MRPLFAFLICFLSALPALAQEAVPDRYIAITRDMDFPGGDLRPLFDTSFEACSTACLTDPDCNAFTFNQRSNACFPKTAMLAQEPYEGALSAQVYPTDPAVLSRLGGRVAALSFLQSGDLASARNQAEGLATRQYAGTWTADQLVQAARDAAGRGDRQAAMRLTGAAITRSDAPALWSEYARHQLALGNLSDQLRYQLETGAIHAAINAALRAPDGPVLADALDVLAQGLERRGRGRDMIPALRLALAQGYRDDLSQALDRAIGLYGFRVVETQVDNEAALPRICVIFSEDLAPGGVSYGDFLQSAVTGLSVEAEERQLCISGVSHGQRYEMTLRAGLPAASGEVLQAPVSIRQYVQDRTPGVRFPGRAYILPRSEAAAIPVVAVNTDAVALRLFRVSDRNLVRSLQEEYFGRPLNAWEINRFTTELAEEVWTGTGEVAQDLNRDVTTRLPMGDVLADLGPGLYALEARAANLPARDTAAATQWFLVSDLGLSAMSGADGVHVVVRGLSDAGARPGLTVSLISESNRVLGEAVSDADGYALFEAGLALGRAGAAPAMVTVTDGDVDYAFLSLREAEFDLSDRGVEGREAAGAIDLFLTTERGAYRAGETIHATALARDGQAGAITGLPLTAVLTRADGVEYTRQLLEETGAGGFVFALPLGTNVPRGTWRLAVHADTNAAPLASRTLLVEDFLPERIDVTLNLPEGPIRPAGLLPQLELQADYLFGAPAGDLPIEGELALRARATLEDWPSYRFGRHDDSPQPRFAELPGGTVTSADGSAMLPLDLPDISGPPHPRDLTVTLRVSEGSGRPVERQITRNVEPQGALIGIRPLFDGALPEDSEAAFDLIAVNANGALPVTWTLNRVERRYQWYSRNGAWNWEPVTSRTRIATGEAVLGNDPVRITQALQWGEFELRVESSSGAYTTSSVGFSAGWYAPAGASGTPDVLDVSLDAESYRPGDTAELRIVPRRGGTALIRVMSNRLIDMRIVELGDDPVEIALPVTDDWGSGAYVSATLLRPVSRIDTQTPARALGLAHAHIDPGERALDVALDAPAEAMPRGPLDIALRVENTAPGDTVYATIAAVDLGILNLTGFESPDPAGHYFGQRRLGMALRDVYGRLIDSRSGAEGRVRSGGDGGSAGRMQAPPPTEALVAFQSGALTVGADGLARARFDIPSFNGTVRVMAIAWSQTGIGQAEADVLIRDPVVLSASLPRFMAPGDTARMLLEITHATGPTGPVTIGISNGEGLDIGAYPVSVTLGEGQTQRLSVPVTAGTGTGLQEITVALTTPDGTVLTKPLALPVQVNDPELAETSLIALNPGEVFTLDASVFTGLRPGSGRATLSAGPLARFDAPGLLQMLDRYPYGCTEQVTSRAMPLLYLSSVAEAMELTTAADLDLRIAQAIDEVLVNQAGNGGFGLWGAYSGDLWLDAYVTDFLSRARAQGYQVPDLAFSRAIDNLRNEVSFYPDFETGGEDLAYALMVLAREGTASMGDLRYYADVKAVEFSNPMALGQLGAALAMYGDQPRADAMFRAGYALLRSKQSQPEFTGWRVDYGSNRRDAAGLLTLAVAAGSDAVPVSDLATALSPAGHALSTQEATWSLLAAHALIDADPISDLQIDGQPVTGPLVEVLRAGDSTSRAITNAGTSRQSLTFTRFGVPAGATEAFGNGYRITRSYVTLEGQPADPADVPVGTRLVALLTVTPFEDREARLMVNDPLPAGFEIDNPNLIRGGDIRALDGVALDDVATHTEFRQDRFLAAVDWRSDRSFRLGYIVRAVTPGDFHHPAASVEDMYRPQYRAQTASARLMVTGE
ncbi:alpha-2-macroglobulin family protein [Rhodophyticola sp. CCM32]|uniref:alpha-2-macroglobulin family protein n=1 Tax=Rhodophyticola sp. CCM32 TaxID=2916397 RepID=UPI00107F6B36|nr:alpha-2-macroglobulin family protein [Rhodophyticola sp. CCM32]QBY01952.1 alpha-2-macroglobulin family protein [Rhodophyticola sp. CCM32]